MEANVMRVIEDAPRAVCPNCGCLDMRKFCPECGQEHVELLPSLRRMASEAISEFLSFDSKILLTLRGLLRPGFLTNEYFAGRRAPYFAPLKLYLWISAFYFLAFSFSAQKQMEHSFVVQGTPGRMQSRSTQTTKPDTGNSTRKMKRVEDAGTWFSQNLGTITICLIPGYAGVLSLLHRRKRSYVEHLIFVLHTQSFSFLAALPATFYLFMQTHTILVLLVDATYLPLAMRVFYREPWGTTIFKTVALVFGHFALATLVGMVVTLVYLLLPGK